MLALHARGDAFTDEEKARDFAYYERLTVRDSSLSACTQAVIAAEVGHLELAYDYFGEAALMDLHDLEHNTVDGVHIASLAGAWIAAVAGFGGMRDHDGKLTFAPRLPPRLERLAFRLSFHGCLLKVEVTAAQATYEILEGPSLELAHHGEVVTVDAGDSVTLELPSVPQWPTPTQPYGRAPAHRGKNAREATDEQAGCSRREHASGACRGHSDTHARATGRMCCSRWQQASSRYMRPSMRSSRRSLGRNGATICCADSRRSRVLAAAVALVPALAPGPVRRSPLRWACSHSKQRGSRSPRRLGGAHGEDWTGFLLSSCRSRALRTRGRAALALTKAGRRRYLRRAGNSPRQRLSRCTGSCSGRRGALRDTSAARCRRSRRSFGATA